MGLEYIKNVFLFLQVLLILTTPGKAQSTHPMSVHVLDSVKGINAANVTVSVYSIDEMNDEKPTLISTQVTDTAGRIPALLSPEQVEVGSYLIRYLTEDYFIAHGLNNTMAPFIEVACHIRNISSQTHIPLVISPFHYATYKGALLPPPPV